MYEDFIEALLVFTHALNDTEKKLDAMGHQTDSTPYLDSVPVICEGELVGFLRDEVGGSYGYFEANEADREWWNNRPWKKAE